MPPFLLFVEFYFYNQVGLCGKTLSKRYVECPSQAQKCVLNLMKCPVNHLQVNISNYTLLGVLTCIIVLKTNLVILLKKCFQGNKMFFSC